MPSDAPSEASWQRLHPASILFTLIRQFRALAVPLVLLYVSGGGGGAEWLGWAGYLVPGAAWEIVLTLVFLVPGAIIAAARYAAFRYRYGATDLVIRSGVVFRNERHIPYARIQNLDAVENLLHRLIDVVEVRIDTGSGAKAEATLSVLPRAGLDDMRRRVLPPQPRPLEAAGPAPAEAPPLLALDERELMLSGLIHGRGAVLIAAALGVVWEFDLFGRVTDVLPVRRLTILLPALLVLLVLVRLAGMAWALVRLHGFELSRRGDDLRTEYGLLTRVTATIPLHRIQTLTLRESPLARLFHRASVRVQTAGGGGQGGDWDGSGERDHPSTRQRSWLAPIIRREAVPALLAAVLPRLELDLGAVDWRPVAPGAFRRRLKVGLLLAAAATVPLAVFVRWWALAALALLAVWAAAWARLSVSRLGWAVGKGAVLFRSGWAWRRTSLARFDKIQAVSLHQSPFDRRAAMARLRVDTAGATVLSDALEIPYLPGQVARELYARLVAESAGSAFRW